MNRFWFLAFLLAVAAYSIAAPETPVSSATPLAPPVAAEHTASTAAAKSNPAVTLDVLEAQPEIAVSDSRYWLWALQRTNQAIELIDSNALKTADEFFRVAKLMSASDNRYRTDRNRYELLLAAAALGHRDAELQLASAWDGLLGSLGRPLRTDFTGLAQNYPEFFQVESAPGAVLAVLRDPEKARAAAKSAARNVEIKSIVEADQVDRNGDWSKMTPEESKAVEARDEARNRRMREIIKAGDLHTASDFASAALVMQHSTRFSGFQTAHELAVCSMLLGDRRTGRWLVAATYDRMLGSVGHDQRFATQYNGMGGTETLVHVETAGICDAERKALGCPTLDQARSRK